MPITETKKNRRMRLIVLTAVILYSGLAYQVHLAPSPLKESVVGIDNKIKQDILEHQGEANRIIKLVTEGNAKHQVYNRLSALVDTFGQRLSGSRNLEKAIDYILEELENDGLENVHGENVTVPHWERGDEHAHMILPRKQGLEMLGLGGSVGTPQEGITGEVLVVSSFKELKAKSAQAKGKIIVFNEEWTDYPKTVRYRLKGAVEAAKFGGIAVLIRSVTPFSTYLPHTGMLFYDDAVEKIPAACITIEDAEMMARMAARGVKLVIKLKMDALSLPLSKSRNIVAEITGYKYPDQVVLVGGHIDSWDAGQGAMDNGGGAFISWQALSLINQLKLRPKRTVRLVMWTGEEQNLSGSTQYFKHHKVNISKYDLVMESDLGTFRPTGIQFKGTSKAFAIMKLITKLLKPTNATKLWDFAVVNDVSLWVKHGVPGASLGNENSKYFYFHHSAADTMSVLDPDDMDLCAAVWTVVAYVVADMDNMLPR